jgi:uncharacterized protein (UPF0548 family)
MPYFLTRPDRETIRRFRADQATESWTYQELAATLLGPGGCPTGFVCDHHGAVLGRGAAAFEAARAALGRWAMFDLGWVELCDRDAPLEPGTVVGVLVQTAGPWVLNAARIVYRLDDRLDGRRRFGFAYGTLPGHAECGEERFLVTWDRRSDEVRYDLLAFSRPSYRLARLAYPYTRTLQRRFARASLAAMRRAVAG